RDILANAGTDERRLIDDLQRLLVAPIPMAASRQRSRPSTGDRPSSSGMTRNRESVRAAIDRLARELSSCQSGGGDGCAYVARTAYRFLPEFRSAEMIEELEAAFQESPSREYDLAWLGGYASGRADLTMLNLVREGRIK